MKRCAMWMISLGLLLTVGCANTTTEVRTKSTHAVETRTVVE